MSLLKAIKAQLGLSNTPANNFTITAEADNGTLKLARGNAGATTQDILTVDANGKVAFPQNAQIWQNVTGSRALGMTYTNNTPLPITVSIACISTTAAGLNLTITPGGVFQSNGQATVGFAISLQVVVPPGATYVAALTSGTASALQWMELR